MNELKLLENNIKTVSSMNWNDSPSIQRLLDVISRIIAKEYIQTVKQNPEVFKSQGVHK